MRIKVNVTKNDIVHGFQQESRACPIALAVKKHVHPKFEVVVDKDRMWVFWDCMGDLPKKCISFIDDFDKGKKVKPFSFSMRIPKRFLKKKIGI